MQFPNKKLLLFDLDGTLIDSVPDLANSVNFMLKTLNKQTFDEDTIRSWVGNGAKTLVQRALAGEKNPHALEIFLQHYKTHLCETTTLYPHVKETLHTLYKQGFTLAIITNKPYDFISPILKTLKIDGYFSLIVGADSLKEKKPHPLPLLHVRDTLGFSTEETLMIGDSKNDILAAKSAGIESVGVTYGYNYDEDISQFHPDSTISDFTKLLPLLSPKIAIVGGGIAGSSVAIYLAELGLHVTLFEKKATLVDGPPICHLHAGGNLYREISDTQCLTLLKESIELIRLYPFSVDKRPTVLITPKNDPQTPLELLPRLKKLQNYYAKLINEDAKNKLLGEVEEYFQLFSQEEILKLQKRETPSNPSSFEEWMIIVAKEVNLENVQFPFIMVQEYGLNIFRLAGSVAFMLEAYPNATIRTDTAITNITQDTTTFTLAYNDTEEKFDYLINAAGFESGLIDDMLSFHRERFIEFKAAYVTQSTYNSTIWPEVIFFGQRGTPQGMAQFTPYPHGYFQLHGMTKEITLFEKGLIKNSSLSSHPKLDKAFLEKIYTQWRSDEVQERTHKAILHVSRFIPSFTKATATQKPLFGAQQIPGDNADLRAAEVSFEGERYARCEIVKASSVLAMADAIVETFHLIPKPWRLREFHPLKNLNHQAIDKKASTLAIKRDYPKSLAYLNHPLCYNTKNEEVRK